MVNVGVDIESICKKCGDVWHVVVALVGEKIVKVQCKQCGGQHRYRPPGGAKPAQTTKPARATRATPGDSPKRNSPTKAPRKGVKPRVEVDLSRPVRSYVMGESFAVGDRLEHRVFGEGVVEEIIGLGKIQVYFPVGRKVLVHEKTSEPS